MNFRTLEPHQTIKISFGFEYGIWGLIKLFFPLSIKSNNLFSFAFMQPNEIIREYLLSEFAQEESTSYLILNLLINHYIY